VVRERLNTSIQNNKKAYQHIIKRNIRKKKIANVPVEMIREEGPFLHLKPDYFF